MYINKLKIKKFNTKQVPKQISFKVHGFEPEDIFYIDLLRQYPFFGNKIPKKLLYKLKLVKKANYKKTMKKSIERGYIIDDNLDIFIVKKIDIEKEINITLFFSYTRIEQIKMNVVKINKHYLLRSTIF